MSSSLGKNISILRKKAGLSQAELAEKLGIGTSTLGMYETDRRQPSYETLSSIADFFNKSVDDLLGRETNHKNLSEHPTYKDLGLPYKGYVSEDVNDMYRIMAKNYAEKHKLPKRSDK